MCHVLVEFLVLLRADIALGTRPQRARLVDGLFLAGNALRLLFGAPFFLLHDDRQGDMVGVLLDNALDAPTVEQIVLTLAQMQDNLGAARRLLHRFQCVVALTGRLPAHAVLRAQAGAARQHRDLVSHDKRGIETNAELADQIAVLGLVAGQGFEELARAGLGDCTDVLDHLLARHADAVIGDGQGARVLVE